MQIMTSFDEVVADEYAPTDRPMKIGRYTLGALIGEGKSSTVRRGTREGDKKKVAVKVLNKLAGHHGTLIQLQFQQEVEALRRINHVHVIQMHECLQSQRRYYIVLDLLSGTLLSQYVRKRNGLTEDETQLFSSQLISAVAHIHKNNVVHRDLKPENMIIDPQKQEVTIIDFGLSGSTSTVPHLTRHCGTPAYMAPEVTSTMGYGSAVDLWSLGVSIVEMLKGVAPMLGGVYRKGNYPKLVQRREMFASLPSLSKDCIHFLDHLLQIYPERRMTAAEALEHNWIKAVNNSDKERPTPSPTRHSNSQTPSLSKLNLSSND